MNTNAEPIVVPRDHDCVPGAALRHQATSTPDNCFIRFEAGTSWTYRQALDAALVTAAGLRRAGVKAGDTVVVCLPNGPPIVRCWFALSLLGAVFVPVNTAYRGQMLERVLDNAGANIAIVDAQLLDRLAGIETGPLTHVIVSGDPPDGAETDGLIQLDGHLLLSDRPIEPDTLPCVRPWDLHAIVYTSGTTGASKGVLTSNLHLASMARGGREMITADDHRLVALPLFHSGGLQSVLGTLLLGGSLTLSGVFSTSRFWPIVRDSGATTVTLLGAMIGFLMKAPITAGEREHSLRSAFLVPFPADGPEFAQRFGVDVYTNYNSTETSNPLVSARNPVKAGVCGQPRAGVQARIVDGNDFDVSPGGTGELVLRTTLPWAMSHGYRCNPQATADAWRNGWFHTGELFRQDDDGDFFFVDRIKDAIRRRGENISSIELEHEIAAHPSVLETAIIGVPSEFGEQDVMAVIATQPGIALAPEALLAFLQPRVAHFMIPRYIRTVDALPRTATHKVRKNLLREAGVTPDTWDRESAGIRITQQRIGIGSPPSSTDRSRTP